jgi:putative hydrolase of the HAD superfamily
MVIMFDIDGTLVDHDAAERAGAIALHRMSSSRVPIEEFLSNWSAALERHFTRYVEHENTYQEQGRARVREVIDLALTDRAADRLFAEYLDVYEGAWALYPDVLPCLGSLSRHRLGVISNGLANEQRRKLLATGIGDRFESIVISEECGWAKPSREIFRHACAAVGEMPANIFYIGDRYDLDAYAARRVGMNGVWLDRSGRATKQQSPPIIRTLGEVPVLVKRALDDD